MVFLALVLSLFWFAQKPAEESCPRLPASLASGNNSCKTKLGGGPDLITNSPGWLVNRYLEQDFTTVKQRKEWISFAQNSKPEDGNLFFCIELSNLRELNTGLKDKNLVTSISHKYKEILETLGRQVVRKWDLQEQTLRYSDYKSYQGVYPKLLTKQKSIAEFETDKAKAFAAANKIFSDYLISNGYIKASDKPEDWFRGGLGTSADEASLSARVSRYLTSPNRLRMFSSPEVQEVLRDALQWQVRYLEDISNDLKGTGLLVRTSGGAMIPHLEVFELMRKFESPVELRESLIESFGNLNPERIHTLDRKITPTVIEKLQVYKSLIDIYSPSLMMAERNIANLEMADAGGMSADFMGLGALNLQSLAEALTLSEGSVSKAIVQARAAEVRVTIEFRKKLTAFRKVVQRYYPHTLDSGDDFVAFSDSTLGLAGKKQLLNELAEETANSRKRIAFLAAEARKEERNLIVAHGEAIEKELRIVLKSKINREKLNRLLFGIDMITQNAGEGFVQVLIGAPETLQLSNSELHLIHQGTREAVKKLNSLGNSKYETLYKSF